MADEKQTKTITIVPNYDNLVDGFLRDAVSYLGAMSNPRQKTFTRNDVYKFVSSFRIALSAVTSIESFVKVREAFDSAANKMYEQVTKENDH